MTLAETAYAALRADILRGAFRPDQPLRLAQLRDRYGLGFSPLREALTRLTADRLVVSEALRGFRVAPLSAEELRDMMETRIFIETEALRRSIARGGDDWEAGIVAALHALTLQSRRAQAADPASLEALEGRHRDFHAALIAACGSRQLLGIFDGLYLRSARYRAPWLTRSEALPARDLEAEHSAIAQAALARDPDRAAALLAEHYRRTIAILDATAPERLAEAGAR